MKDHLPSYSATPHSSCDGKIIDNEAFARMQYGIRACHDLASARATLPGNVIHIGQCRCACTLVQRPSLSSDNAAKLGDHPITFLTARRLHLPCSCLLLGIHFVIAASLFCHIMIGCDIVVNKFEVCESSL